MAEFLPASGHCELCGSSDYEDLYTGEDGYTDCCNELMCYEDRCTRVDYHHVEGSSPREPIRFPRNPYSI